MTDKLTIFGQHELNTLDQMHKVAENTMKAALMSDGHAGYVMPVGGVAAYDNRVSVMGVGFDIACGNCAIETNLKLEDVSRHKWTLSDIESNPHYAQADKKLNKIADDIQSTISFGIGRSNNANDAPVDDPLFVDPAWNILPNTGPERGFREELRDKARLQLGTVGSGNHYVDVLIDRQTEHLWVGVHFGSRGLGHTLASNFLAIGQGGTWGDRGKEVETILDLTSPTGYDYWELMNLAGRYAYAGREWVTRKVVSLLGGTEIQMVHNHHNFAWKEKHWFDGEQKEVVVVRKGATPAFPGQKGFVGGSMGDDAVILQGAPWSETETGTLVDAAQIIQNTLAPKALFSTVHGAGRVMSRTEAAGKWRKGIQKSRGRVEPQMMEKWLAEKGVIRRGGGLDESPHVYRRLTDVLKSQGNTIEVLRELKPLIVVMAGSDVRDPYKD